MRNLFVCIGRLTFWTMFGRSSLYGFGVPYDNGRSKSFYLWKFACHW